MTDQEMDPKDLKPNPYSLKWFPKLVGTEHELLKKDIKENGIRVPLEINKNNMILSGHERRTIALELGLKTVPVKVLYLTEQEEKQRVIIDNLARRQLDGPLRIRLSVELNILQGLNVGRPTKIASGDAISVIPQKSSMTEEQIAQITRVSERTTERAVKVAQSDLPQSLKDVVLEHGKSVEPISYLVDKPKSVQQSVAQKIERGASVSQAISMAEVEVKHKEYEEKVKQMTPAEKKELLRTQEELRVNVIEMKQKIYETLSKPEVQKKGKWFKNWLSHCAISDMAESLFCPKCERRDKLKWTCCGITINEATTMIKDEIERGRKQ